MNLSILQIITEHKIEQKARDNYISDMLYILASDKRLNENSKSFSDIYKEYKNQSDKKNDTRHSNEIVHDVFNDVAILLKYEKFKRKGGKNNENI